MADDLHWPEPPPLAFAAVEGSYVGCFGVPVPAEFVFVGLAIVAAVAAVAVAVDVVVVAAAAAVAVVVVAEPCASVRAARASTEPDTPAGWGTLAAPGSSVAEPVTSAAGGLGYSGAHVHWRASEPPAWAKTGFVPYVLVARGAAVFVVTASAVAAEA